MVDNPFDNINAEVIAIGTELLLGALTDTNSVYIAQQLRDLGVNLYFMTSVGDNVGRIAQALNIALERADIIITCGGLGPTVDDMTRAAIAQALDRDLIYHEELFQAIVERFASFRARITENNKRQAFLPEGAAVIENPVGTAPSFRVEVGNKVIVSLPGVPREMKFLMQDAVIPYLREKYNLGIIKARTLKTGGIGESALDELLGDELLNMANPTIGLAAHQGVIDVRITTKAIDMAAADAMIDSVVQRVYERAGDYIFGEESDVIEEVFAKLLQAQNRTIALLEAGINDAIIHRLQPEYPGLVSETYHFNHPDEILVGEESFSNASNMREKAHLVAERIAKDSGVDVTFAVLSLPDVKEQADIDYATVAAVYIDGRVESRAYGFGSQFDLTRDWVSQWLFSRGWRMLKESEQA
ncbi:CinA family nicotinamide mononucleotide deamidase-related protein [Phototrophicus methaneseepsis]|uniref:CinA-like protein n=1 Tax=Phototrophicus methaneseepsis TaxID=2710758 RepID=A0A7S8E6F5_9CHLR|nr:CinA family nicotinamide mononucleotide deamidase-related protein [Phototrophicus methaneseepsis]QPC81246.1 CinA family nicotinamide mononucleotide deamidase-related protein [Phototrophicus methaneseepsis]